MDRAAADGDRGDRRLRRQRQPIFPLPLEARLASVRGVRRAGLVEVKGRALLALELDDGGSLAAVRRRLEDLGLGALKARVVSSIPVDARHQSKIDRPGLIRLLRDGQR